MEIGKSNFNFSLGDFCDQDFRTLICFRKKTIFSGIENGKLYNLVIINQRRKAHTQTDTHTLTKHNTPIPSLGDLILSNLSEFLQNY